jgi:hypothetical protein
MSQGHGNVNTSTIVCRNKSPLLFDDREPSDVQTNYEYNDDEYNDESNNDEHNNDEIPTSQGILSILRTFCVCVCYAYIPMKTAYSK